MSTYLLMGQLYFDTKINQPLRSCFGLARYTLRRSCLELPTYAFFYTHRYVITVPASATFLKKRERKLDADCRLHSSRLRQKTDVKAEAGHFSVIEVSLSEAIHPLWRCNEVPTASIATIITDSSLDNKHYHLHCKHRRV